jgi:hypothetical protein
MSFVQRRRFLWILFLAGLALLAVAANATTLSRLRFDELATQAAAVARLRCLGAESRWQDGEIWTETRFEVVELNKGQLPGMVSIRMLGGSVGALHSRIEGVPAFRLGKEAYLFCGGMKESRSASLAGRKVLFELRAMRGPVWNWSPRIPRPRRSLIRARASFATAASVIYR